MKKIYIFILTLLCLVNFAYSLDYNASYFFENDYLESVGKTYGIAKNASISRHLTPFYTNNSYFYLTLYNNSVPDAGATNFNTTKKLINLTTNQTFMFWVRLENAGNSGNLITQGINNTLDYLNIFTTADQRLRYNIVGISDFNLYSNITIQNNTWTHITFQQEYLETPKYHTRRIFFNGELVANSSPSSEVLADAYTFLGYDGGSYGYQINTPIGIDNFLFFNASLTDQQIKNIYLDDISKLSNPIIDNCSNVIGVKTNATTLGISYKNIDNTSQVKVNATISISGDYTFYNTEYEKNSNTLCIYPAWANLSVSLGITYWLGTSYNYYNFDTYLNNITQNLTLYVDVGEQETTFTISDIESSVVLPNVLITIQKRINGVFQTITSKYTDITGKSKFSYDTNTEYKFILQKNGYESYTFILNPILFASYNVKLTKLVTINETIDYDRISIIYSPQVFYNNKTNTFTFNIYSPYNELEYYGFSLATKNGETTYWTGATASGSTISNDLTINNAVTGDRVRLDYYYKLTDQPQVNFTYFYPIITNYTSKVMIGNKDNTYGLGILERVLISTLIIIVVAGIASLIGSISMGGVLACIIFGFFAYIGFLPLWLVLVPITLILFMVGMGTGS